MKTDVLECVITALSSVSHNGGERNGIVTQLRREKFVQPNGEIEEVPVISGNSIRGKLRDIAAQDILMGKDGKIQVDADTFNLLFTGGSLESTGELGVSVEKVRTIRKELPILAVLGCSVGNLIMPGKVDIGKMIPICEETAHLIPSEFVNKDDLKSIFDYVQTEMLVRKDDAKDENLRGFLTEQGIEEKQKSQMMYKNETLPAGIKFYWKVCLRDVSDEEMGAFLSVLNMWLAGSVQIGGNGRVGHGRIEVSKKKTYTVNSEEAFNENEFVKFIDKYNASKVDISEKLKSGLEKGLFGGKKK